MWSNRKAFPTISLLLLQPEEHEASSFSAGCFSNQPFCLGSGDESLSCVCFCLHHMHAVVLTALLLGICTSSADT
jgi:hypothetical protein